MGRALNPPAPSAACHDPAAPVRVVAHRREQRIVRVDVHARPLAPVERLLGLTVEEAVLGAPDLFPDWGPAQAAALAAACGAARGEALPAGEAAVRLERDLAAEAAQVHLARLLQDWPSLFGRAAPRHRFVHLPRRLGQLRDAREAYTLAGDVLDLVANELLSGFYQALREPTTLAEFVTLARRGGTLGATLADLIELGAYVPPEEVCAPLLPTLSAAEWAAGLGGMPGPDFCRQPARQGQACETGVLPRHRDNSLVAKLMGQGHRIAARLFARVVDLGDCASRLRHPLPADLPPLRDAAPLGPDCGLARIDSARGLLLHAVRLQGERLAEAAIVGPEAWNFQAQGPLPREAGGRPAPDAEQALLRLRALVLALDPGTAFEVMLEEDPRAT